MKLFKWLAFAVVGLVAVALALKANRAPAAMLQDLPYDTVVVAASFDDPALVAEVAAWNEPWEVDYAKGVLILEVDAVGFNRLLAAGFRVEIDEAFTNLINRPLTKLPGQVSGIPGYPCYRTVEETFATAEGIASAYPDLATWIDIGDSWEKVAALGGYDLLVLRLTNAQVPGPKPKLFISTSVHAREYTPPELATRFAEYLVDNYGLDADATWLLDHHEVHLLLMTNPDGRKQAEIGLSWRKNTNQNYCSPTSTSRGADLNRNFVFAWGCCGGSSGSECDSTYRGPSPASEPETQAVQDYVYSQYPDLRDPDIGAAAPITTTGIFLDIHSYSELVLWPWGFTPTPAGNALALQTLGRKFAYFNDYYPEQAIGLYPTDGTTEDFAYGELGLPAYTFELGTSFFQSCGLFESTILPDNLEALIYAAKTLRRPYLLPAGPDALDLALTDNLVAPGEVVTLTATVNDTRYNNQNGTEPTQNIMAAEAYLDTPDWITTTVPVPIPMAPVDGSFNSAVEAVDVPLDTTGLPLGRHLVYVRGQDASGNWGTYSAVFLYVVDPAVSPTIQGQVIAADTGLPLTATVSAGAVFQTETIPATGMFALQVISGTYDLTAQPFAAGYAAQTIPGILAEDNQTVEQDFALFPYCVAFSDDVESGNPGWTAEAPWAITEENAHSPTHSWTDSPGGNYSNNRNISLTSPVFDLTDYEGVTLNYWQICDTEAGWDYCNVEISTDGGGNWNAIASYDGNSSIWEEITLLLPALDNQSNARVRFRFSSDTSITDDGWHIDDIQVLGAGPACVEAIAPLASFDSSSPDPLGISTVFTNTSTGTGLSFAWDLGDGTPVISVTNPTHTYPAIGTYTVVLTATNNLGSDVATGLVEILEPPLAVFSTSRPDILGETTVFTNTSTGTDLTFSWDFGDSSPVLTSTHPVHIYNYGGFYTVTLTATNGLGVSATTETVEIKDPNFYLYLPEIPRSWDPQP
jgi:PKD repeat protein